jgi:hypothetical protein
VFLFYILYISCFCFIFVYFVFLFYILCILCFCFIFCIFRVFVLFLCILCFCFILCILCFCFIFCVFVLFCIVFCTVSPFVYCCLFPISVQVYRPLPPDRNQTSQTTAVLWVIQWYWPVGQFCSTETQKTQHFVTIQEGTLIETGRFVSEHNTNSMQWAEPIMGS